MTPDAIDFMVYAVGASASLWVVGFVGGLFYAFIRRLRDVA